jgi:hypothetical protein
MAATAVIALPASALQIPPFSIPGTFELDGNATTGAHSGLPDDWDRVCYQVNTLDPMAAGLPPTGVNCSTTTGVTIPGNTARAWAFQPANNGTTFTGGGSKDPIDISSWAWNQGSGGLPGKDILLNGFAARYSTPGDASTCPGSSSTVPCNEVFFGMDRFDNSGDAQNGFWFLQNKITPTMTTKSGAGFTFTCFGPTATPCHMNGDVLVVSDFSIGGTISTITVYEWDTTCTAAGKPDPGCADSNLRTLQTLAAASCQGPGSTPSAPFCGIINLTNTPSPWLFADKAGTLPANTFAPGEFYEGGIDLTNFAGLAKECFATSLAESRSSTSTSAVLKSFVLENFGSCTSKIVTSSNPTGVVPIGTGSVSVTDSATVTVGGAATWTGNVVFTLCGPNAGTCDTGGSPIGSPVPVNQSTNMPVTASTTVTAVGSYCWRADFNSTTTGVPNATHSGAADAGECFTVTSSNITTTATPHTAVTIPTAIPLPGSIVTVSDSATVTVGGITTWSGFVAFSLCGPSPDTCASGGTSVSTGNAVSNSTTTVSASTTVTSVGSYCWRADFTSSTSGVPNATHSGVGDSNECFTVGPVTPTLTTQASATVLLNNPISDTATLSGTAEQPGSPVIGGGVGPPAGGSITFKLFGPNTGVCGPLVTTLGPFPVTGDNTYNSGNFTPTSVGTYTWEAIYTPDTSGNTNGASATACPDPSGKENVTVTDTSSATSGQTWRPQDTATVMSTSGKPTLSGTLSIQLYEGSGCVAANAVSGQSYSTGPFTNLSTATVTSANNSYDVSISKSVSWLVTFTSNDPNVVGTSHCENTTLTIAN